jgi:hypothetical protein
MSAAWLFLHARVSAHLARSRRTFHLASDVVNEFADCKVQANIHMPAFFDSRNSVHHGRMVFAPELTANFGYRRVGHLLDEIHRDLARHGHCSFRVVLVELLCRHAKEVGYRVRDG